MGLIPNMQLTQHSESINAIHNINRLKKVNHMIIYIHAEKAFDIIQRLFMIKNSLEIRNMWKHPQLG